jgi:hypothetical protein
VKGERKKDKGQRNRNPGCGMGNQELKILKNTGKREKQPCALMQ